MVSIAGLRRRRSAEFALALGGVVLTFVVAEGALRGWTRVKQARRDARATPHYTWSTYATDGRRISAVTGPLKLILDPVLLYRNMPDQRAPWFAINSRGYRGAELRDTGGPRILLVGGSAAFGTGLPSDGDTLAAALEHELGGITEVVNAAVVGYVSGQERVLLDTELLDLGPQAIVAFDGWNDLRSGRIVRDGVIAPDGFFGLQNKCWTGSNVETSPLFALRKLLGHTFPALSRQVGRAFVGRTHAGLQPGGKQRVARRAAAYARNVRAMAASCRSRGVRFLAVLQPDRDRVADYEAFRKLALGLLGGAGVEFFDAAGLDDLDRTHFTDPVHLNADGTRVVAHAVASRLAQGVLARQRANPGGADKVRHPNGSCEAGDCFRGRFTGPSNPRVGAVVVASPQRSRI